MTEDPKPGRRFRHQNRPRSVTWRVVLLVIVLAAIVILRRTLLADG
jgi:hypothetical protein